MILKNVEKNVRRYLRLQNKCQARTLKKDIGLGIYIPTRYLNSKNKEN